MKALFFGRKDEQKKAQEAAKVDLPAAITKSKDAIDTLQKRQNHLEKRIQSLLEEAKLRVTKKDVEGAKVALQRKKMLENELAQLSNARLTLEQQINSLESQQAQHLAVEALSTGVQVQKQLNTNLNISSLDKLMDDLQEQQERQQEVNSVLSQNAPYVDETELMDELSRIQEQELDLQLAGIAAVPTAASPVASVLPATPVAASAPAPKGLSDEEQLRQLEAELAL